MESPKKAKSFLSKKRIFSTLLIVALIFGASLLRVDITPLAKNIIPRVFPETHQNLNFDRADLNGDLSISLHHFNYQPDPPLVIESQRVDINFSLIKFLFGYLEISKISSNKFEVSIPSNTPWLKTKAFKKKKVQISKRTEWFSLLNSTLKTDTLSINLHKNTFVFSDFKGNQNLKNDHINIDASWSFMFSNYTPNLYDGELEFSVQPNQWKGNISSNTPLGPLNIVAMSGKAFESIDGEIIIDSKLDKISAWLFKPQTQIQGDFKSRIQFNSKLNSPLAYFSAQGSFKSENLEIQGLAFQEQDFIKSMAPELKKIELDELEFDAHLDSKKLSFKNIKAKGSQLNLEGYLDSDWDGNFFTKLNIILSDKSTEKLSSLAQNSLNKNKNGEAYFPVEISGTPRDHSLTNLGQLVTGAVGNQIKKIGNKILDIF